MALRGSELSCLIGRGRVRADQSQNLGAKPEMVKPEFFSVVESLA
jgi:hypothetical protein